MHAPDNTHLSSGEAPHEAYTPYQHIEFNIDDYVDDLNGLDVSEEEAHELLSVLWKIMMTMVDMGWGFDPIHTILPDIFNQACNADSSSIMVKKDMPALDSVIQTPAKDTHNDT